MARANCRAVHVNTVRSIAPSRKCTCQSSGRRIVSVSGAGGIEAILIGTLLDKTRLGADKPDALVGLLDHLLESVCRRARQGAAVAVAADNSQPQFQPLRPLALECLYQAYIEDRAAVDRLLSSRRRIGGRRIGGQDMTGCIVGWAH